MVYLVANNIESSGNGVVGDISTTKKHIFDNGVYHLNLLDFNGNDNVVEVSKLILSYYNISANESLIKEITDCILRAAGNLPFVGYTDDFKSVRGFFVEQLRLIVLVDSDYHLSKDDGWFLAEPKFIYFSVI